MINLKELKEKVEAVKAIEYYISIDPATILTLISVIEHQTRALENVLESAGVEVDGWPKASLFAKQALKFTGDRIKLD